QPVQQVSGDPVSYRFAHFLRHRLRTSPCRLEDLRHFEEYARIARRAGEDARTTLGNTENRVNAGPAESGVVCPAPQAALDLHFLAHLGRDVFECLAVLELLFELR